MICQWLAVCYDRLNTAAFKFPKMKTFLALLIVAGLGYCSGAVDLSAYPFSSVLKADAGGNPIYTLYWNFSTVEQTIRFAVSVQTNGWVGFGISPNGGMVNSDVVIGWVNDDGQAFLQVSLFHALDLVWLARALHSYEQPPYL